MNLIRKSIYTFIIVALLPLTASAKVTGISLNEAKSLYDQGAVFIDTRSYIERSFGVVKGAIAISKNEVTKKIDMLPKDKKSIIVTYCAKGIRADVTARKLDELGYENVYVIVKTGYSGWKKKGFPTE